MSRKVVKTDERGDFDNKDGWMYVWKDVMDGMYDGCMLTLAAYNTVQHASPTNTWNNCGTQRVVVQV